LLQPSASVAWKKAVITGVLQLSASAKVACTSAEAAASILVGSSCAFCQLPSGVLNKCMWLLQLTVLGRAAAVLADTQ
jgi:hypothetical protein